jgi:hypothetical protein
MGIKKSIPWGCNMGLVDIFIDENQTRMIEESYTSANVSELG